MTQFTAKVIENIPANRLINLAGLGSVGDRDLNTIYLQTGQLGEIPDLVSTGDLEGGTETTVTIKNNPIWTVEAAQFLPAGTLVQCAEDGRVKDYRPEDGSYIGFTTHSAEEGQTVSVVRKSGIMPQSQIETMSMQQEKPKAETTKKKASTKKKKSDGES
ncbi:MAG TPA: hypothetical protein VK048_02130 [Atopostipes sp.]|nr:hypothetical protein [Atopostipes sp.]